MEEYECAGLGPPGSVQDDDDVASDDGIHRHKSIDRRFSEIRWARRGSASDQISFNEIVSGAKDAAEQEHGMGLLQAIKTYPNAVGWSVLASTALVMEGYDIVVIYNFFSFPAFTQKYGKLDHGSYQISAGWQSALSNGNSVGQMLGLLITGFIADRYGYRKTITGGMLLVICFIFITFFAPSIEVLFVGELLCGIPWGAFQTVTAAYAAEVSPVALRPYLTSYINLCWVMGQMIGSGVGRALVSRTDEWAYRIPFALQWIWPIPLLIGISLAPESPWWLVRKSRLEDAETSVKRLTSTKHEPLFDAQKAIAMMVHTNELEKSVAEGTSYLDCFRGVDLRRTEICCMVWMIQSLCGGGLMSYATYFYEQAGLSVTDSFDMTMAQYGLGAIGVVVAWALMPWFGRRTLYISGLAVMCVLLLVIGFVSLGDQDEATAWAIGSMLLLYTFVYDCTIGPLCYSLVSELSSTRLRQKSVALARNAFIACYIINNVLTPRMLNPTAWDWRGKTGFFWAGSCFLSLVWAYFRLPEPKGRTYAELDMLFEKGVSARKFASEVVDPFVHDVGHGIVVDEKDGVVAGFQGKETPLAMEKEEVDGR